MSEQAFASIWDAIEDTRAEAQNMKLRSALMRALEAHVRAKGLNQNQAAKMFGVTQPRVSDLLRGKITLFSLDTLINMAVAAGLHVDMRICNPHDDSPQSDMTEAEGAASEGIVSKAPLRRGTRRARQTAASHTRVMPASAGRSA